MREPDYDNALNILRDIYWVGFYDEEAHLHCNPYLLVDDKDVVFFDPGSIPHFPIVMRKVIDIVRPEEITLIVASHQDPDVCGSLAVMEDVINRKDLKIAAHTSTIRLIRHYGLNSGFYDVMKEGLQYTLQSGRVLEFIPTPFLHAPGAIATYDVKTRTLFTSDLFGALDREPMKNFSLPWRPFTVSTCLPGQSFGPVWNGSKDTPSTGFSPSTGPSSKGNKSRRPSLISRTLTAGWIFPGNNYETIRQGDRPDQ